MYPVERRDALVKLLSEKGFVSIRDLAVQLDVSEITIRRDLKVLQRQGAVERVVGGGQVTKSASEPPFINKRVLQQVEKAHIAGRALDLIESGMTIGLSAGTTTWTIAGQIKPNGDNLQNLTFVTNSTNIAIALQANGWTDIHLTGGQFRTPSDALVGPLAEESARKFHVDLLFLGAHGVDLSAGISSPNLQEASIHRIFMDRAESVVLVFDHTKWGIRSLAHVATLEEVDVIVTDPLPSNLKIENLCELGPEVFTVAVN